ncbi:hypothetical protein [Burkholderia sp. Ac-20353]|uniref:hypothetical protein n=1 Tax=Burkholderia sp. Ac-20353 TaxID=2703894 RepID=UPI001F11B3DA|nr:hypothetical protein [Burkholderia sp. Ac-20353]
MPPTFPPARVPAPCAQFVRGWAPSWQPLAPLTRDGLEAAFGFGLTVDGGVVPLIARMRRGGQGARPTPVPERDPRQRGLF